jgi:hypothetical protein
VTLERFQYEVRVGHYKRPVARFVYAQDAVEYAKSDHARHYCPTGGVPHLDERDDVIERDGKRWYPLYTDEDFEIVDLNKDERRVVGLTSHHNAILEAISRG